MLPSGGNHAAQASVLEMSMRKGFTLVELLVVLLIIAILVAILAPRAEQTIQRAKESAVKAHCASIEGALAVFASRNDGFYPGSAIDCMAPFDSPQALGDPALYASVNWPFTGNIIQGVFGGFGHFNRGMTGSVQEQMDNAKNTPLTVGNTDYLRIFDALILEDALQEYPTNPFRAMTPGRVNKMRNIFWIITPPNFYSDFTDTVNMNNLGADSPLACLKSGNAGGFPGVETNIANPVDQGVLLEQFPYPLPYDGNLFNAEQFSQVCAFGTDEGDFFSPGDFAYVPVLSATAFPALDDPETVRDESFRFAVGVRDYLMFGYGSAEGDGQRYAEEQADFAKTGLPGYGRPGVDTRYEMVVLQLFNGAVYFHQSY